ncbi:hypothetical protein [Paenibacillus sp. O199]|uniref:hypothetical protein n=1 Tax=Paenibacillus sp. O199 TaxID=1643925 RepID=UPI0007BFB15F|nr:hypothetical protein [Paenibacillus sp. O199]
MLKQDVMWTALPNGLKNNRLCLSVLVSPRLMAQHQDRILELHQFPDFLDWPSIKPHFSVSFANGPTLNATVVVAPPPRGTDPSELWKALFLSKTTVQPYVFNPEEFHLRKIRSFPVNKLVSLIKDIYSEVGLNTPTELPHPDRISLPQLEPSEEVGEAIEDLLCENGAIGDESAIPELSTLPTWQGEMYQFNKFYSKNDPQKRIEPQVPQLDFHQIISSLGDYPYLMRLLGLVIDLEVDFDPGIPLNGSLSIVPTWPSTSMNTDSCPQTLYSLDPTAKTFFAASEKSSKIKEGYLEIHDPNAGTNQQPYSVIQVDADGTAFKFKDFVRNIRELENDSKDSIKGALPSLRSNGLSLVYGGQAWDLLLLLKTSVTQHSNIETGGGMLSAEHLVRGYRVDVWDEDSNKWYSLCQRIGTYNFTNIQHILKMVKDEGFISPIITTGTDETPKQDLHMHQSLFTWTGWSLVTPRPGKIIDAPVNQSMVNDIHLETSFTPANRSLPKLRFGKRYSLRIRVVDLAGNSRKLEENSSSLSTTQTEEVFYSRYEPVESPLVNFVNPTKIDKSVYQMVIKSDTPTSVRKFDPPVISQILAEQHAYFDTPSGQLNPGAYDDFANGNVLSDPFSRGAAFYGLPGMKQDEIKKISFFHHGKIRPFDIKLEKNEHGTVPTMPIWNEHDRILHVYLPKAESVTVQLSSYLNEGDANVMGIYRDLKAKGTSIDHPITDQLRDLALEGRLWMLTPSREITLVHAVRQPLLAPAFKHFKINRNKGETYAVLTDSIGVCGKSTAKLDIQAKWDEPIDALTEAKYKVLSHKAHVCEIKVDPSMTNANLDYSYEFSDTKFRKITFTANATSRFSEYFQEEVLASQIDFFSVLQLNRPIVEDSEIVTSTEINNICFKRGKDYFINYEKGTLTRTNYGAIREGEKVSVRYSYLPESVTRQADYPVVIDICNSAPPASPKILHSIPTFEWDPKKDSVLRKGGRLRIYLDRPWFSSGDGEMLGVVIFPAGTKLPENVAPYVTNWGKDSIRIDDGILPPLPQTSHFTRAVKCSPVELQELPGTIVEVAGHDVKYEDARKLWCCDLDIDSGDAYYPFIRLALARYQPMSVAGAHLSRVVLMDFIQLPPNRLFSIQKDPDNLQKLNVSLTGPGYLSGTSGALGGEVEVQLEIKKDESWLPIPNATFSLSTTKANPSSWTGHVTLPNECEEYRLIIKEYERYKTDEDPPNDSERRLVFAAELKYKNGRPC